MAHFLLSQQYQFASQFMKRYLIIYVFDGEFMIELIKADSIYKALEEFENSEIRFHEIHSIIQIK